MTRTEATFMAAFLKILSRHMGRASCNDMFLPDTSENRALVKAANKEFQKETPEYPSEVRLYAVHGKGKPKMIGTSDFIVFGYLQAKFMEENGVKQADLPNMENW